MEEEEMTEALLLRIDELSLEELRKRSKTEKMWNRVLTEKIRICVDSNPIEESSSGCSIF